MFFNFTIFCSLTSPSAVIARVACVPTRQSSTFFVTAVAGYVCLQSKATAGGLSGSPGGGGGQQLQTPIDRLLSKLPDAVVLGANWAVALLAGATAIGAWLVEGLDPAVRLVGAVSIPAAIVAVALALSSGSGVPTSLRPLLAVAGAGSAVDASLAPDARKSFHLASIAYCVAMTSLTRGYPFGLVNLLDAANTAGPMLMEPENVAALGAWCFAVITGVLGLMKTPGGEEGRGNTKKKNMDTNKKEGGASSGRGGGGGTSPAEEDEEGDTTMKTFTV